eukprot:189298_1
MATTLFLYLMIVLLRSQRVTLLSSPLTSNTDGWKMNYISSGKIVTSSRCPAASTCFRLSDDEEFYQYIDTRGYTDIQISYDIRTWGADSGDSCSFWWLKGTACPSCGGWLKESD